MTVCEKETSYAECVTASFEVSLQLSGRRGRETGKETDRRGEEERGDGEIIGQRDWARGARGREGREGEAFCARGTWQRAGQTERDQERQRTYNS